MLMSLGAVAQRTPTPNDTIQSPKVLDDKRVMIQIYGPKAEEVGTRGLTGGNTSLNTPRYCSGNKRSSRLDDYVYNLAETKFIREGQT